MSIEAYPLCWPQGWPRTKNGMQMWGGRFKGPKPEGQGWRQPVTLDTARRKLFAELDRMSDVRNVILSSNVPLRNDGMPRSSFGSLDDVGVALYFQMRGKPLAMACDKFDTVAANVRSLGLAIEAMRQLDRHGGGAMVERAFAGFAALPPPRTCWDILGIPPTNDRDRVMAAFRSLAMKCHPDTGSTLTIDFAELVRARDEAVGDI